MYAATTKDEGNAADGRFSAACQDSPSGHKNRKRNLVSIVDYRLQILEGRDIPTIDQNDAALLQREILL